MIIIQTRPAGIIDYNLAAFETAASLETALVHQKGFVTYYLLDGGAYCLRRLGEYRQIFWKRHGQGHAVAPDQCPEGSRP